MKSTRIVHCKKSPYDIYIGRPSIYRNPFIIGPHGDRANVIRAFRDYARAKIKDDASFRRAVLDLEGKTLGCWCAPQACHGDVLVELIQEIKGGKI